MKDIALWTFVAFSIVVGIIARDRGRSFFFWSVLSLLISPLLGFLLLVVVELLGIGKKRLG